MLDGPADGNSEQPKVVDSQAERTLPGSSVMLPPGGQTDEVMITVRSDCQTQRALASWTALLLGGLIHWMEKRSEQLKPPEEVRLDERPLSVGLSKESTMEVPSVANTASLREGGSGEMRTLRT